MATRPKTAQVLHDLILETFAERSLKASQSQYDRGVNIRAVMTAREVFKAVPVHGTAAEYHRHILTEIAALKDHYNDPNGEYTSGKAPIGDVYMDIYSLMAPDD